MNLEQLYAPFKLKQRAGLGGMKFDYIPSDDVIDRMNKVFDGMWSTMVMNEEKVEDMIVVRVRVCAFDHETEREICHDGYGSGQIARFSGGQNKGQSIDVGNAYKSAESKAIRNACTRFGVGLYLKDAAPKAVDHNPPSQLPPVTSPAPTMPPVAPPAPPVDVPTPPAPPAPPVAPVAPVAPVVPDNPVPPAVPPKTAAKPSPFPTTPPPVATPEAKEVAPAPKVAPKAGGPSDIQKAALSGMVVLTELSLKELLTKALEEKGMDTSNVPDSIDDLDYDQAVVAIKFGSSYKK